MRAQLEVTHQLGDRVRDIEQLRLELSRELELNEEQSSHLLEVVWISFVFGNYDCGRCRRRASWSSRWARPAGRSPSARSASV